MIIFVRLLHYEDCFAVTAEIKTGSIGVAAAAETGLILSSPIFIATLPMPTLFFIYLILIIPLNTKNKKKSQDQLQ